MRFTCAYMRALRTQIKRFFLNNSSFRNIQLVNHCGLTKQNVCNKTIKDHDIILSTVTEEVPFYFIKYKAKNR